MKGRKPALKVIEGSLSKAPRAPSFLSFEARQEWKRIVPVLIERRVLSETDLTLVETYCSVIATMRRLQDTIAREGDMVGTKRHPMYATLLSLLTESRQLANELGLTPASRSRAEAAPPGQAIDDDDYADLGV